MNIHEWLASIITCSISQTVVILVPFETIPGMNCQIDYSTLIPTLKEEEFEESSTLIRKSTPYVGSTKAPRIPSQEQPRTRTG
jgi:hypothetical protein